jgi:hypothetical protein
MRCARIVVVAVIVTLVALFAILGTAEATPINLVVNGDFETGDFTGWTRSGSLLSNFVRDRRPHSGRYAAELGPPFAPGSLSQTLATEVGLTYDLDFWLRADADFHIRPRDFFEVWLNDVLIFREVDRLSHGYQDHLFSFDATGPTTLRFAFQHPQGWFTLDDVSVMEATEVVPEPTTFSLLLVGAGWAGLARLRPRRRDARSPASSDPDGLHAN